MVANQTYQTTRFVRSLLRGLTAALRNLPTLHRVLYLEYVDADKNFNRTRMKELNKVMDQLRDAGNLFFTIGLCQLLEMYSLVSLESQSSKHFPIQVKLILLIYIC